MKIRTTGRMPKGKLTFSAGLKEAIKKGVVKPHNWVSETGEVPMKGEEVNISDELEKQNVQWEKEHKDKVVDEGAISERPEAGKEDKNLTQIDQFYGTTQYYNVMGTRVTDGIKYLMDNGYGWMVTDAVAVLRAEPKVMGEEFVSIKLKRNATGGCVIRYEDGNEKLLYQQKYDYTDAKVDVQMFYENGVLLLPSEH